MKLKRSMGLWMATALVVYGWLEWRQRRLPAAPISVTTDEDAFSLRRRRTPPPKVGVEH